LESPFTPRRAAAFTIKITTQAPAL